MVSAWLPFRVYFCLFVFLFEKQPVQPLLRCSGQVAAAWSMRLLWVGCLFEYVLKIAYNTMQLCFVWRGIESSKCFLGIPECGWFLTTRWEWQSR